VSVSGDWAVEDFELKGPTLPAVRPTVRTNPKPPPDTIFLCDFCHLHVLKLLKNQWWCYRDGELRDAPTLVYDRRR